ncbi:hypothetical protein [Nonomuraea coxensis]|uniref:hypothetical protein n=1 Tax=Nonomuraea coxensis TaxID=404386 RepID=UPI001FE6FBAD|nr:hypothetical protein [Nonomuraea coxensis]
MDTGIAPEGDSPLVDVRGRSFRITLGNHALPELDLHRIPKMFPNHLKGLVSDLLRQIPRDLLGGVEHATGGPRGHHLVREAHRGRHSGLTWRERRGQHRMGRSSHPIVPTTLPTGLG